MESAIQRAAWAVVVASVLVVCEVAAEGDDQKVFLREFTLIRRDHLPEETAEGPGGHKPDDSNSRTARSEEDRDTLWDAWGPWSECSRTCGGGASYSLRRCLSSRTCEGQNIKYRTCSNVDCPPGAGDFRAQQCSAHADVRHQGRYHDWIPVDNDPENPCALKCRAQGSDLVVELAPKVLDGTRCYTESLDMCINGACQIVGCDLELGSPAKEDNCGVCNGDGSSCRLVRGHYKSQQMAGKSDDTVVVVPFGSRHVRLVLKGPDHLYLESKTLQGLKDESSLSDSGQHYLENTTIDFQKFPDKEVLRMTGPLGADFTIKIQSVGSADSVVQFIFYQPIIHRWRETDFFPCSVTCGGGYQLTSAECYDLRNDRVIVDQYCHYYPENIKPKPKLQECNMDPCPASDGYKQIMPYDLYHPLPRWESSPWTACSTSCGGGIQTRSVSCVEEDIQGTVTATEEWKCLYATKTPILQPCNTFDCPTWLAQEWSPCTVTCGQGLRYRVVLCVDYRGLHAGGCNAKTKPHIKEECLVPVPCYKPVEKLPVEAKSPWFKQAQELDEETTVSEEPTFVPGPWSPCSHTCGAGTQHRTVQCQVLLSFTQTMADLPDDECEGSKPPKTQSCYQSPCRDLRVESQPGSRDRGQAEEEEEEERTGPSDREELYEWEYEGYTECSESCGGGVQEAVVICRNKQTREPLKESLCVRIRRPPQQLRACGTAPCPPRWETGAWSTCSATCGVGLQTRSVSCVHPRTNANNHTVTASDKACRSPKPTMVQACNRFDCPPMWEQQDWGLCSHSCLNGTQKRRVPCKQRLADGSVLELPDAFCPSPAPATVQPCAWKACPPKWIPTEWSQCSVTCGEGTQSLMLVCQQQDEGGEHRTLTPSACSTPPPPGAFRTCSLGPCTRTFKPSSTKQVPSILAQRKVYIQWRKEKKLQFVTGGYAYLFPRTSVVIRCPTQRFRKDQVDWLKDGKPLANTPNLVITPLGYVKIQHLGPTNTGLYTCLAGQAREDFVLKLTGSKRKLAVEEADILKTNSNGKVYPESPSPQDRWLSLSRYDAVIQRLLDLKGLAQNGQDSRELRESAERNGSALENEDMMREAQSPAMLVVEMWRLDEILRNLSLWPGELEGTHGNEVLVRLLGELVRHRGDSNESTLLRPEWSEPPKQASDTHRATSSFGAGTFQSGISTAFVRETPRAPTIIQKSQKSQKTDHKSSSEVVAYVGALLLLPQATTSIELKCEASGVPEPVVTWSKDGKELHYSDSPAARSLTEDPGPEQG
ncbi:ADAMTS-like protein 1 isoform X1 [Scleropages formosus]|uniref:ADAMTS-like protein 1 isoform X1 n=2 Tax=Scleropages formosus TaxID=113540 RepID=UPI000878C724|nr:ADAMTS-like protein 1 isoform X1 [Scleropages formosus]